MGAPMTERLFGTNGVRGIINQDMTAQLTLDLGKAIGTFMGGTVALASDTRTSGHMLRSAVSAGMTSVGAEVVDLGMMPTPALQFYVKRNDVSGGVMITASHNPPEFNGIKCIDSDGTEMPREKEERIERIYFQGGFALKGWDQVGQILPRPGATHSYSRAVQAQVDGRAIAEADLTVILDCANGAGSVVTPDLLDALGVRAITLNSNPQGSFPGHPSEPTPENLEGLISAVRGSSASLGIAHDGDADRTIFVDENGSYVYGDKTLALVSREMVREEGGTVVTPVSSSSCVADVVREQGGELVYTQVGAPVVARKMMEIGATFGGEENGGLIFPSHQYCRDGAMAAVKVLEIVARNGPLSRLLSTIPDYFLDKRKVECPEGKKSGILARLEGEDLEGEVETTDGVKVFFEDGWTLIRPSGTEPIVRIYSEGRTREAAQAHGREFEALVKRLLEQ